MRVRNRAMKLEAYLVLDVFAYAFLHECCSCEDLDRPLNFTNDSELGLREVA
jgi:hypothetical protein